MIVDLAQPIAAYFAAANTDDADCIAGCFAEDAVVRDEGQDIRGRGKYHFHAEVIAVAQAGDRTVVTAHLTGDFPGNPVDLQYRFKLTGPKIIALEIG